MQALPGPPPVAIVDLERNDLGRIAEADAEKWRAVMNVNLFGNFLTMKHACRLMKPRRRGVIIHVDPEGFR